MRVIAHREHLAMIVSAHPDPVSLTDALRDMAMGQLHADGHDVQVSDLYAMDWKAAVDRQDFPPLDLSERLRVPAASGEALAQGPLTNDVVAEQDKIF